MFKYAIIDNSKRSECGLLTVESIVGAVEAPSRKAALQGFEGDYGAVLESKLQGKGQRKYREKIEQLREVKETPKCSICSSTEHLMQGSIDVLCADCYDDVEADI